MLQLDKCRIFYLQEFGVFGRIGCKIRRIEHLQNVARFYAHGFTKIT